jgi:hypothetical protein
MVVLADNDRTLARLSAKQTASIVDGTDEVLESLTERLDAAHRQRDPALAPEPDEAADRAKDGRAVLFHCVGGRGDVDDAAAAVIAFGLRQRGLSAEDSRRAQPVEGARQKGPVLLVVCYASHPSQAVRRYNVRKLRAGVGRIRHVVIDYEVAPMTDLVARVGLADDDVIAGDIAAISRSMQQQSTTVLETTG